MPRLDKPFARPILPSYNDSLIEYWIYAGGIVPHGQFKVEWGDWEHHLRCDHPLVGIQGRYNELWTE